MTFTDHLPAIPDSVSCHPAWQQVRSGLRPIIERYRKELLKWDVTEIGERTKSETMTFAINDQCRLRIRHDAPDDQGLVNWFLGLDQWWRLSAQSQVSEVERRHLLEEVRRRQDFLKWLKGHLCSEKFAVEPYINVGDILHAMQQHGIY